jgi:hypothetical protein
VTNSGQTAEQARGIATPRFRRSNAYHRLGLARREEGFALVIVTIILAALSLVVASALSTTQERVIAVADAVDSMRLDTAVDAAFATAAAGLAGTSVDVPLRLGQPFTISAVGVETKTVVLPATAKLDLNSAEPVRLLALFRAAGLEPKRAARLVDQVVAWRSNENPSSVTREQNPDAPRRFVSVDELGLLPDSGSDVVSCLKSDLTVFSGASAADGAFASERLRAVTGATSAPTGGIVSALGPGRPDLPITVSAGEVFEIVTQAKSTETGRQVAIETDVRTTGSLSNPIWVIARTRLDPDASQEGACAALRQSGKLADAR